MASSPPPLPSPNTAFILHIPARPSLHDQADHPVDHVLLSIDSPRALLTMILPVGRCRWPMSPATWEWWITFLLTAFVKKFNTGSFEHNILLNLACLYRAFTIGPRCMHVNSDFYVAFTHGLVTLAEGAMGRCVKRDLALYVADMTVLVPYSYREEVLASLFQVPRDTADSTSEPSDLDVVPDAMMSAAPSPSISTVSELAERGADDSGYKSFDSMPSLCTVYDSSDEYKSDSSEEPESDEEEEALISMGFVVDESEAEVSDLEL